MGTMKWRALSLVLASTLVGCAGLPGGVTTSPQVLSQSAGALDLGVAGSGYAIASVTAETAAGTSSGTQPEKPTYTSVMFVPDAIAIRYAGPLTEEELKAAPQDVNGAEAVVPHETTTADEGDASAIPTDGWITFPIKDGLAPIDLSKLSSGAETLSFGHASLPPGKYDQIRLVAGKPGSPADQNPLDWKGTLSDGSAVNGKYFLPSNRLTINQGFEIRNGYKTDLKFTFDAKASMVIAGDMTLLKPGAVKVYADYAAVIEASPSPQPSATPAP